MNNIFKIKLKDFDEIKTFVLCNSNCPSDIDVSLDGFKRSVVDGKSILGVITICSGKRIDVKLRTDDENIIAAYKHHITPFLMEE